VKFLSIIHDVLQIAPMEYIKQSSDEVDIRGTESKYDSRKINSYPSKVGACLFFSICRFAVCCYAVRGAPPPLPPARHHTTALHSLLFRRSLVPLGGHVLQKRKSGTATYISGQNRGPKLLPWDFGVRVVMRAHCPSHAPVVRFHAEALGEAIWQNTRGHTHSRYSLTLA